MDINRLLALDIIWVGSPLPESANVSALLTLFKVGQPGGSAADPSQEVEPPRHGCSLCA
ncbi:hypothetical protein HB770_00695 [Rhizobium leguminosarum bv. viciae]|uniref:Uncharacterized protein n=1 Tax=Rhizobium leguminosarum bv. viciae TaxID=387 RepID=A0A7G6RH62_RHILV|nr:hypothetical protein HB770_00695 [Rhizobium leguminosarum bv. viciae]